MKHWGSQKTGKLIKENMMVTGRRPSCMPTKCDCTEREKKNDFKIILNALSVLSYTVGGLAYTAVNKSELEWTEVKR